MIEFLLAGVPLLLLMLAIVQLSLLWAGKSAVDTAAHLASRKFASGAREDFRKAREMAFLEAFQVCRNRPGGSFGSAAMTSTSSAPSSRRTKWNAPPGPLPSISSTCTIE
jgi:Flp pilus assembly protein TadG